MLHSSSYFFFAILLKTCPIFAFLFSVISIFITVYISAEISPIYAFFCIQMYLNWYSAYKIAKNTSTLKIDNLNNRSTIINIYQRSNTLLSERETKFWFCEKCQNYTSKATLHCPLCKKCYHFRDHHCFFMGTCILRQNIGNFILFCFYAAIMCLYSLSVIGPYLYEHLNHFIKSGSSFFNILLSFCFPIALARFIFSEEDSCLLLVTLFDALVAIFCLGICYGSWKLKACVSGKQRYNYNLQKKASIGEIFGNRGLLNALFPFDSIIGSNFNKTYEMKEM